MQVEFSFRKETVVRLNDFEHWAHSFLPYSFGIAGWSLSASNVKPPSGMQLSHHWVVAVTQTISLNPSIDRDIFDKKRTRRMAPPRPFRFLRHGVRLAVKGVRAGVGGTVRLVWPRRNQNKRSRTHSRTPFTEHWYHASPHTLN